LKNNILNQSSKIIQDVEENQLAKVLREKEDLQLLLNKFERHMAEVNS
jgi:hypothetical protein